MLLTKCLFEKKRTLSFVLSLVMLIGIAPITAKAKDDLSILQTKAVYADDGSYVFRTFDESGNVVDTTGSNQEFTLDSYDYIPSEYDAREDNLITSVKNQGGFGTCWAFSYCSAAESSLIAQGYETNTSVDLSESHLVRFQTVYNENSSIPVEQDTYLNNKSIWRAGGNQYYATATVSRYSGFAKEEDFPYSSAESAMDYSMDYAYNCDYTLKSVKRLNTREDMKQSILTYGAIIASFYNNSYYYYDNGESYSYYQSKTTSINHGISIVGWDDNYSADNFLYEPESDGAWLCKNSWGTSWGMNGYFWMSYEEASITECYEIVASPNKYDNNYQYTGILCPYSLTSNEDLYGANIFKATDYENIKAASFHLLMNAPFECEVTVYTNLTDSSDPTSGIKGETVTLNVNSTGFYMAQFKNSYAIEPNQLFSIVVKYHNTADTGNTKSSLPIENTAATDALYHIDEGQSFVAKSLDKWIDLSTYLTCGNTPIKAYSDNAPAVESLEIVSTPKTNYKIGEQFDTGSLSVKAYYSDNTSKIIDNNALTIMGFNSEKIGTYNIEISYCGVITTFEVNVDERIIVSTKNNAVIDMENMLISGFDSDLSSLDDYIILANGYTYTCSSIGTGGKVNVYRDDKLIETYELVIFGDINGDAKHDGMDSTYLNCIINGMISVSSLSNAEKTAADCNHDGEINASDVELMFSAGLGESEILQNF